jgi:hypothetical protein
VKKEKEEDICLYFPLFLETTEIIEGNKLGIQICNGEPDWSKLKHLPKKHIKGRLNLTMMGCVLPCSTTYTQTLRLTVRDYVL